MLLMVRNVIFFIFYHTFSYFYSHEERRENEIFYKIKYEGIQTRKKKDQP